MIFVDNITSICAGNSIVVGVSNNEKVHTLSRQGDYLDIFDEMLVSPCMPSYIEFAVLNQRDDLMLYGSDRLLLFNKTSRSVYWRDVPNIEILTFSVHNTFLCQEGSSDIVVLDSTLAHRTTIEEEALQTAPLLVSGNEKYLLSSPRGRRQRVWDVGHGNNPRPIEIEGLATSITDSVVASVDRDVCRIYSTRDGYLTELKQKNGCNYTNSAVSKFYLYLEAAGVVEVYSFPSLEMKKEVPSKHGHTMYVVPSDRGLYVSTLSRDLYFIDPRPGVSLPESIFPSGLCSVSSNGKIAAFYEKTHRNLHIKNFYQQKETPLCHTAIQTKAAHAL